MEFDASRMLAEAMSEVRAAASEISRLLEAAPRADTRALVSLCSQLDALAFRARALSLEARIEGLGRGQGAARFTQLSAEIAILADRCAEAVNLIGRLRAARQEGEEHHLGAPMLSVAQSSSGAPP